MLMAMITVTLSMAILSSILITRRMAIRSESQAFGRIWAKAILSEYDRHLLQDYGLMAFFANNEMVANRIAYYMNYSMKDRLQVQINGASAELNGFEMSDPDNFREAIQKSFGTEAVDSLLKKEKRKARTSGSASKSKTSGASSDRESSDAKSSSGSETQKNVREILNPLVIRTLPSHGGDDGESVDSALSILKSGDYSDSVTSLVQSAPAEFLFIRRHMNSHLKTADSKKHYFVNEWEYIIKGSMNDDTNLKGCRRRIFLIRNALNLIYLYKDPSKVEAVTTIAELITPGPAGVLTQAIIMEAWAALESETDVQNLLDGKRVPVMKTAKTWNTGLEGVLNDSDMKEKLDEESRKLLEEKSEEVHEAAGESIRQTIEEGLTYEDYLMVLMAAMGSETRTLRVMDLVQINMKYRYYRDFNLAEYYGGVNFTMKVSGKKYTFSREYR